METSVKGSKITILGAGSWGMTLAWLLGNADRDVTVWSRDKHRLQQIEQLRQVDRPLSVSIPESVHVAADLESAVENAGIILFCCTAQSMRAVAQSVAKAMSARVGARSGGGARPSQAILVSAAKGLELKTFQRMTQVLSYCLPGYPVCTLSGPNLAVEILQGLPAAAVVASEDAEVAKTAQQQLSTPAFRLYSNSDVVGVELGGALKNIIAIAAGAVDGLKLGTNAKAALMTRGLAEMARLSSVMGANPATLAGLAGNGDLIATCYSSLSRNYRLGFNVAQGESPKKAIEQLGAVAEGATTATAVFELSKNLDIQMPIAEVVTRTLGGEITPEKAIMTLMSRPLSSE